MRVGHFVLVGLGRSDPAFAFERGDDRRLRLADGHPAKRTPACAVMRPSSPITEISLETVAGADVEVVGVVRRASP